ncbi:MULTISPECIES: hypothetical protein [Moorena]|uniref:hypothetical protein n=1 Tax=Moorena TaxID=1155738 RepID=UPI000906E932|nr:MULTISPECIES: hypothetical protein [Moorena]NEP30222.1 hypothetical protein [Moorena sp. SIO3B2]NEP64779.1 hypothetical protein [Moorena sp. SIO3A5]NEQ04962.1 hypothetical protein [Moorena sp. SIO4E2]NER87544.1 hypothetical protein [Moorena sp. SIO3A2]NET63174.1 hypothetical protein [Moorena sp. SIO1G6]
MLPLFLILLVTALGSILISWRVSHEIPRLLGVGSTIVCLIFGFAMAPWPVQVLMLLLILSLERFYPFSRTASEAILISKVSNTKREW